MAGTKCSLIRCVYYRLSPNPPRTRASGDNLLFDEGKAEGEEKEIPFAPDADVNCPFIFSACPSTRALSKALIHSKRDRLRLSPLPKFPEASVHDRCMAPGLFPKRKMTSCALCFMTTSLARNDDDYSRREFCRTQLPRVFRSLSLSLSLSFSASSCLSVGKVSPIIISLPADIPAIN